METALEHRLEELEKEVAELKRCVVGRPNTTRDWRRAAGMLEDTAWSREVDQLGEEWRRSQTKP